MEDKDFNTIYSLQDKNICFVLGGGWSGGVGGSNPMQPLKNHYFFVGFSIHINTYLFQTSLSEKGTV